MMDPVPGERLLRFTGDRLRFALRSTNGGTPPKDCRAYLRTNLGRAEQVREEIIQSYTNRLPSGGAAWRDIAMHRDQDEWRLDLPLAQVGYFQAKAYMVDAKGRQFWPDGPNVGITVHPDQYRTGNTIYCAFVRMFGGTKESSVTVNPALEKRLARLDKHDYTVIPPSGKLRDLIKELPHIVDTLGCRILHLLPVGPTPTTYARFGRFGSPYASQDLVAIDLALVEFDRRTTGIDQFRELTHAAHLRGARVVLDIVTNHTGWGSTLQEHHPEWFLRDADGRFVSPGAWGVTWEDLVELNHRNPASWEYLADVFLTWCRRGVDGFRCDAGYKVPMPAWRYITACVRQEYPETLFLLEGLGGSWEATESLLTDGGMQWAYSELFQNYSGSEVANYLEYAHRQSQRAGLYVHYSETHDNDRLAKNGRQWSALRNQLSALTSVSGGYGFTCGVEWLASEKIVVHSSRGLNWGSPDNLVCELAQLNRVLAHHPCFFDHARLTRLSLPNSPVYALRRDSNEGHDSVLVLINTDTKRAHKFSLDSAVYEDLGRPAVDLLGFDAVQAEVPSGSRQVLFTLPPGACQCLSKSAQPLGLGGDAYRHARACANFGVKALAQVLPAEDIGAFSWRALAERVNQDPRGFLAALLHLDISRARVDVLAAIDHTLTEPCFPQVVLWKAADVRRITLVPPTHWLLVQDQFPFRVSLNAAGAPHPTHVHSIAVQGGFAAFFPPQSAAGDAQLFLERYAPGQQHLEATVRFLTARPEVTGLPLTYRDARTRAGEPTPIILLTNGRGGMARLGSDLARVNSKYDCLLAANLHPSVPVDRHVFAKRLRVWLIADRFITPLDHSNLVFCDPGPPARWRFVGNAGDGRCVEVHLEADMLEERNATVVRFHRPVSAPAFGKDLPEICDVRLTVRVDLEDRNFHWETKRNSGADHHFGSHCRPLAGRIGFEFTPASDRNLYVVTDRGEYHHEAEWCENIPHPFEQSRGQMDRGDAYSPGWFDLPLAKGTGVTIAVSADPVDAIAAEIENFSALRESRNASKPRAAKLPEQDPFGRRLALAVHQFVVRRGDGKTVIAGYPWFLDWGRDTFICARGLLSAGLVQEVQQMLVTFARFEQNGTLPNSIYGEDASNRDTSDAPLWFGVVCEEVAAMLSGKIYELVIDAQGRTLLDVLRSIADGYLRGTPNGIRVDPETALVWSPSHFTWMDTNYPAATPREGYPVEIQVLWIRLLKQLSKIDALQASRWSELAVRGHAAFLRLFWLEQSGYLADCLLARPGQSASTSTPDTALRSNYLLAISMGLISGEQARRCVAAALQHLVIPGALRSLAPLPVSPPLPVHGSDGRLLSDPRQPYQGRYEGDEDTRRKPAYHNGTAWTWTFPTFCEALVMAWDYQPNAIAAAQAYLGSVDRLLTEGCLGQMPEILDGDAPHTQRGCDAQAWGATETLRVWKWLQSIAKQTQSPPLNRSPQNEISNPVLDRSRGNEG